MAGATNGVPVPMNSAIRLAVPGVLDNPTSMGLVIGERDARISLSTGSAVTASSAAAAPNKCLRVLRQVIIGASTA
jgi:hypothetical protein